MAAVDPVQRRGEIVDAAYRLVADGGIEAATMRRIALAAGATTGRVTHYFNSRVDVLVAVLVEVDRRRQLRIAGHANLDPSARLRSVVLERLPLDTARLNEQRVWLALSSTGIPELRDELARQSHHWDALIGSLIKTAGSQGHEDDTTTSIVALIDGLSIGLTLDPRARTRRTAERVVDELLRGLGSHD